MGCPGPRAHIKCMPAQYGINMGCPCPRAHIKCMSAQYGHVGRVSDCQSACVATSNCNGIDWNNASPPGDTQCWFIFKGTTNVGTAPNVDHYDLSCSRKNKK